MIIFFQTSGTYHEGVLLVRPVRSWSPEVSYSIISTGFNRVACDSSAAVSFKVRAR